LVLLVLLIRVLLHVLLDFTVLVVLIHRTLVFVPLVASTLMLQQLV
jgi:hypothetical protein